MYNIYRYFLIMYNYFVVEYMYRVFDWDVGKFIVDVLMSF